MIHIPCDFDGVSRDAPEIGDMPNRRARKAFRRLLACYNDQMRSHEAHMEQLMGNHVLRYMTWSDALGRHFARNN
jgi:hypothetical protein